MATKLLTPLGGGVTLEAANTATDKTLTLPADNGTVVYANSSGNVGIGSSSPQSTFQVGSIDAGTSESTNKGLVQIQSAPSSIDSAGGLEFKTSSSGSGYGWKIGGLNAAGDPFVIGNRANSATFTERMRIDSSGKLLVGTTTVNGTEILQIKAGGVQWSAGPNTTNGNFDVLNASGTGVYLANGGTSWIGLSDETTKDIIEPIENAAEKVATLRAVIGKYKTDDEGVRRSFLIAQDVQAVLPEAVNENYDGKLGLSYTDVIPLLVAAIQEQQAIIQTLTSRIEALENQQ